MSEQQPPNPGLGKEGNEKIDLRILLADDDASLRRLFMKMLSPKYSSVEAVENGLLLVEKLSSPDANFNFIVTDNDMPEMSGLEAIRKIRAAGNMIPIIMVTSYSGKAEVYESFRKEVEALDVVLLSKPVTGSVLCAAINDRLAKQK